MRSCSYAILQTPKFLFEFFKKFISIYGDHKHLAVVLCLLFGLLCLFVDVDKHFFLCGHMCDYYVVFRLSS